MSRRLVFTTILLFCAAFAAAQSEPSPKAALPRAELYGGFAGAGGGPLGFGKGWHFGSDFRMHGPLYFVVDGSQTWDGNQPGNGINNMSNSNSLFGVRYWFRPFPSGASLFTQGLAGIDSLRNSGQSYTWNYNNATSPALAADLGLHIPLTTHWSTAFQGGYFWTLLKNSTYGGPVSPANVTLNRGRFFVDVVYHFK
ncbi:MAG: hypothetical protein ACLGSD_17515 [Acidobacteriota bacterium]